MTALLHFPQTPAIYYCHGWLPWEEAPLCHPNILRYVAVDELCQERLVAEGGIAAERIELILNFVDIDRFPSRPALPATPRRALAFGNQLFEHSDLPIIRQACRQTGIELDAAGSGSGKVVTDPGPLLAQYDVVFAKARAALESMAVGTAVVLCGSGRAGPMVSTENFCRLRPLNFGIRTLGAPLTSDWLATQLGRYDASDAMEVSRLVRRHCALGSAVDRIVDLYERVIDEARCGRFGPSQEADRAASQYLERSAPRFKTAEAAEHRLRAMEAQIAGQEQERVRSAAASETELKALRTRVLEYEEDRNRWVRICHEQEEAATNSARQTEAMTQKLVQQCQQSQEAIHALEKQSEALQRDLSSIRNSACWRWSQVILQNGLAKLLLGPWIRAVRDEVRASIRQPRTRRAGRFVTVSNADSALDHAARFGAECVRPAGFPPEARPRALSKAARQFHRRQLAPRNNIHHRPPGGLAGSGRSG
jgi:hypothetical protein